MPNNDTANELLCNKLEEYQNKLLSLSKKNRCIRLGRLYKKHSFDLSELSKIGKEKIINDIMQQLFSPRKKPVRIILDSDNSNEAIRIRNNLQTLSRNIKQLEDETGSQYCYLGFPFLEGHINENDYIRGPILLFPISFVRKQSPKSGWYIEFLDQPPSYNRSLFKLLEINGNYQMPSDFESDLEELFESEYVETEFLVNLVKLLEKFELPLDTQNISQQIVPSNIENYTFTTQLESMTSREIESLSRQPLRVCNYKIAGSFPQGESAIYADYDDLIYEMSNGETNA